MKSEDPGPEKDLGNLASVSTRQTLLRLGPPQLLWAKGTPSLTLLSSRAVSPSFPHRGEENASSSSTCSPHLLELYPYPTCSPHLLGAVP